MRRGVADSSISPTLPTPNYSRLIKNQKFVLIAISLLNPTLLFFSDTAILSGNVQLNAMTSKFSVENFLGSNLLATKDLSPNS